MAREFSKKFYNSKQWIKCRNSFKQSKFHICNRCGEPGEEVHHIIYLTPENINDPYITLSFENLELLCSSCHSTEHNRKYKEVVRNGLKFDNFGNLVVDDG
jgi:5-methylcytosine-specific restriction endonuclease McrA